MMRAIVTALALIALAAIHADAQTCAQTLGGTNYDCATQCEGGASGRDFFDFTGGIVSGNFDLVIPGAFPFGCSCKAPGNPPAFDQGPGFICALADGVGVGAGMVGRAFPDRLVATTIIETGQVCKSQCVPTNRGPSSAISLLGSAITAAAGGVGRIQISNIALSPRASGDPDGQACDVGATVRNVGDRTCESIIVEFFGLSLADSTLRIASAVDFLGPIPPGEARLFDGSMIHDQTSEFLNCDQFRLDDDIEVFVLSDCGE